MKSIEVLNKQDKLQQIFFKIPKETLRVWNLEVIINYRRILTDSVTRNNPEEKVNDLFEKFEYLS